MVNVDINDLWGKVEALAIGFSTLVALNAQHSKVVISALEAAIETGEKYQGDEERAKTAVNGMRQILALVKESLESVERVRQSPDAKP